MTDSSEVVDPGCAAGACRGPVQSGFYVCRWKGCLQDDKTAVKWFTLAAQQGFALAQNNLGFMYATGQGVLQDDIYAHMWYNIAASSGHENAEKNREIVAGKMSSADISAARKRARDCVAKNYKGC